METQVVLSILAVVALVAAIVALARLRRASQIMETKVLIGEAMARRGITPADAEAAGLETKMALAQSRCENCLSEAACRVLLSKGEGDVPATCPNRDFFDTVEADKWAQSERRQKII